MPETPKEGTECELPEPKESHDEGSVEKDQQDRGYYYDDAHGYEVYADTDAENDEDDQELPLPR